MCRTTLPLDLKRSGGRIVYNSREKEDFLSLKEKRPKFATASFSFLLPHIFFSFVFIPSFCLSFFSFSYLIFSSFFSFISPHFLLSLCISLLLFGALTIWVKGGSFLPSFLKPNVCLSYFHSFSFISLFSFMTSYPTWLNMRHGIMPPMWLNVSHPCGSM